MSQKWKYRCEECSLNFQTNFSYIKHQELHHNCVTRCPQPMENTSAISVAKDWKDTKKAKRWKTPEKYKFRCEQCHKPFHREDSFKAHLNFHNGIIPWECEICGKRFKGRGRYMYHIKNHYGQRDYKCDICDKAFLIEWDLRIHMRTHSSDRPYICETCGKTFRMYCNLANHRECHNEKNKYECEICQAKLHTTVTLRRHMDIVHKVDLTISKTCRFCNQNFTLLRRYEEHMKRCHPDIETLEDSLYNSSYLKINNKSVQNKSSKHKCGECGEIFGLYKHYSQHIRIHRKALQTYDGNSIGKERKRKCIDDDDKLFNPQIKRKKKKKPPQKYDYRCEYCKKPFMSEDSYQAHLRAHMGLPRYSCDICGKGFKEKNKFEYHMKNHKGERDWKCSVCEKAFLIEWDLELHMRTHTDYRPYVCEICGKAFRVICHLTEHRETHNDTNTFECTICGSKLHTRKTLRGHMASAHRMGKIRYCPVCDQSFVRNHRLKDHIARYHSEISLGT